MTDTLKVLAISGSLRKDSYNTAALHAARDAAPADISIEFADLSRIPLYDQDQRDENVPAAVTRLVEQVKEADALLFATPEYNYSMSGVLKNAIDWVSREQPQPFAGKPAAIMSASMSLLGGVRAQYDLRRSMVFLDMHCVNKPEVMIASAHERFDAEGRLTDETTREFIAKLVTALGDWTRQLQAGEQR
ncbi:NAD(P)H-dependent oxidoreductase [Halomonas sp. KAO]|uniref:NADPH-dependent FMN reductase n=1 Tax=unclassified Halomonas TaxID=2609666 RepID=UPI00189C9E5D|nr:MULTISPECIES: NAD(P)H-dependent oxidoreductase [unclassified Halomonas]MBF7054984.1 NAD(P)H-dependent oxidoreductase [Halomonas sp. KAO]MDT0501428.1 NAD(P)H-dependent oxidoreductase [Halomonas sp. PAR7]MDT0512898.1 NAD(P)H-dependent oxidoreductase [Halomonas sp. LES1]MDT0591277.1 NAD(P)H-dependent oxidoreductase [Halomonas sp. PAR8]